MKKNVYIHYPTFSTFICKASQAKLVVINKVFQTSLYLLYLSFAWHKTGFEMISNSMFGSRLSCSGITVLPTWLVMCGPGFLHTKNMLCPLRFLLYFVFALAVSMLHDLNSQFSFFVN